MTKTERRFVALRVAGGLLPADFLGKVAALDAGQDIAAYGLTKSLNMRDEIGRHRRIASDLWADFRAIRASAQVERTADRWLLPFLSRGLLSPSRGRPSVNDHSFHHPPRQRMLDAAGAVLPGVRPRQAGRRLRRGEGRRRTPHSLVREFFNADDGALWGIVSNGLVFRILRDNPSLTLPGLHRDGPGAHLREQALRRFAAFWLTAHATRFLPREDNLPSSCIFERWRASAQEISERHPGKAPLRRH